MKLSDNQNLQLTKKNQNQIYKELFHVPAEAMDYHLNLPLNNRILFSGRFGIGKTTFLKHYFKEKSELYHVIHLFPVNYSILGNEDVIRYIKYDILLSIMDSYSISKKKVDYKFLNNWDDFIYENLDDIISTACLLIPKMGKQLSQFVDKFKALSEKIKDFKKPQIQRENEELLNFMSKIKSNDGGLYEFNSISTLITIWLDHICSSAQNKKEAVLIIDDLDRIDPFHIFRLLNVFSSHFDQNDGFGRRHKFGFSKIILVCDIDNIKNIYASQYGLNSDFNGYIDKFYSKQIFRFDNKEYLLSYIRIILSQIKVEIIFPDDDELLSQRGDGEMNLVELVIVHLIECNQINLRSIFNFYQSKIEIPHQIINVRKSKLAISDFLFLSSIYTLKMIVGDFEILKEKVINSRELKIDSEDFIYYLGQIALICQPQHHDKFTGNPNEYNANFNFHLGVKHINLEGSLSYSKSHYRMVECKPRKVSINGNEVSFYGYSKFKEILLSILNEIQI